MPDAGLGRTRRLAFAVLAAAAWAAEPGRAAEAPPAQGTRLRFQKTLSIQATPRGRVFLETRPVVQGDTLQRILEREYGVTAEGVPELTEAFREANPGLDPDRLPPGRTVRIPFKIEETPGAPAPPAPPPAPERSYVVRAGESLWRILKNRFRVGRDAMPKALKAVARANPSVKDLNHLVAGQRLAIPGSLAGEAPPAAPARPAPAPAPEGARALYGLLEQLGCRVSSSGDTFLPLGRGRTVHLDSREFPLIAGLGGKRVILDPGSRLSVALTRSVEGAWGYTVVQGTEGGLEAALSRLLPHLGFHSLAEGPRAVDAVPGARLLARPRWTVVPRPEDLWEGRIHLLFPSGARLDPDLAALTLDEGFSLHLLGEAPRAPAADAAAPGEVPELAAFEPGRAEGALLAALGVAHRVRPDVECDLGGGVSYHLRPELTFDFDGTAYAVPPPEPRRAEALLERTGYFTVPLPDPAAPLDRLRDLLALLRIRAERARVVAPSEDAALRLTVEGLAFEAPEAVRRLYPSADAAVRRVLVTEAALPPRAARVLLGQGYAPWILRRTREGRAP